MFAVDTGELLVCRHPEDEADLQFNAVCLASKQVIPVMLLRRNDQCTLSYQNNVRGITNWHGHTHSQPGIGSDLP